MNKNLSQLYNNSWINIFFLSKLYDFNSRISDL